MSITDINNAAAAQNALTAAINGFMGDADAQIAARQAAYDALATDLRGVVGSEMQFNGTVDPDVAPTNVEGGTFATIKSLIDAAPEGARVVAGLKAGVTHTIDDDVNLRSHHVYLYKAGDGANPVINHLAWTDGSYNHLRKFVPYGLCSIRAYQVDFQLPTASADATKAWSAARSIMHYQLGMPSWFGLNYCTVNGGIPGIGLGVMTASGGGAPSLGLYQSTLDGPIYGVSYASAGTPTIAASATTYANGAAAHQGGTVGTNILKN